MCDGVPGGTVAAMLYCVACGCCSGELGKGWAAFRCDDPEKGQGPEIAIWCPVCAAAEFGYRPEVAAAYVRAWEPRPGDTTDRLG
jgi:hypothetical protein